MKSMCHHRIRGNTISNEKEKMLKKRLVRFTSDLWGYFKAILQENQSTYDNSLGMNKWDNLLKFILRDINHFLKKTNMK